VLGPPESRGVLTGISEVVDLVVPEPELPPLPARAQEMFAAIGGRAGWSRLEALHLKLEIQAGQQAITTEQWLSVAEPFQRVELDMNGQRSVQVLDGDRGFELRGTDTRMLSQPELEGRQEQKRRSLWALLVHLARGTGGLEASAEGPNALVIEGTGGLNARIYLDAEQRPAGLSYRMGEQQRDFLYSDWRSESGLSWAAQVVEQGSGMIWKLNLFLPMDRLDRSLLDPR